MNTANHPDEPKQSWALRLFQKSVLKQNKLRNILRHLGENSHPGKSRRFDGLRCLDIGADNGVISHFLRQRGGRWASADLSPTAVASIRSLVTNDVHLLDGGRTLFADSEFDRIVIVDFLEHIQDDADFVGELRRILKDDGLLVINCPHRKESLLRKFRLAIGQTDEKHGHLRPGYTVEDLHHLAHGRFELVASWTYSRFFTEALDTFITASMGLLRGRGHGDEGPSKGVLVTEQDMRTYEKAFRLYVLIYPLFWLMTRLDGLLFFCSGYCLISRWRPVSAGKPPASRSVSASESVSVSASESVSGSQSLSQSQSKRLEA